MPHRDDVQAFVMEFVGASRRYKSQFHEMWQELAANFIVDPDFLSNSPNTTNPYRNQRTLNQGVILKDQETHKAIMSWAANLVNTVLGDQRGEYVQARPVGWEDARGKARTTTGLLRYDFGVPGVFRSLVEGVVESLLYGTAFLEIPWRYREVNQLQRTVETVSNPFGPPLELDSFQYLPTVAYDDPEINVIDTQDAFPDPSEYRLDRMCGFAKRFRVNYFVAKRSEIYDEEAVKRAIEATQHFLKNKDQAGLTIEDEFREGYDQPHDRESAGDFSKMVGFEYWGDVPWRYTDPMSDDPIQATQKGGQDRGVVTVLMGEIVRNRAYPYADPDLPFRSLTPVPVVGRTYGISLAEVMRFDQDILDALKVLLVEAVVRKVHPPIAYDENSELDPALLRRWSPDVPIPINGGINSVGTLRYDADVFSGIGLGQTFKTSAEESVANTSALQGAEGPSREPATAATLRFQQALSRPGLTAALMEREEFPAIARSLIRRNQQFLDSDGLRLRVGELPDPTWIGDIMGDFDVRFIGSRIATTRADKLAAMDRLINLAAAIPQANLLIPWLEFLPRLFGDVLDLPEVAASIGQSNTVALNWMLGQGQNSVSNNNGTAQAAEPPGILPAQAAGEVNLG